MFVTVSCECGRVFEAPEAWAGLSVACPDCGRMVDVPVPEIPPDLFFIRDEPPKVSGRAIASLVFGLAFMFACLTGLPAIVFGVGALGDIDRSKGRLRGKGLAIAGIILGVIGCLFTIALLMPAFRSARGAAKRAQCVNNLKQIGLAIDNYHTSFDQFPAAAILSKDGKPLLSWRVAILPFIESSDLYSKFHLDEPWDSPHNLTLLDQCPSCYRCPGDDALKSWETTYQVIVGPRTAFPPDFKPVTIQSFTDGASRTILVGESTRAVPWTKPDDLPPGGNVPLAGLGSKHGYHNNGFNVLMADGSVRFLKSTIDPKSLDALLTRDGGEVLAPPD